MIDRPAAIVVYFKDDRPDSHRFLALRWLSTFSDQRLGTNRIICAYCFSRLNFLDRKDDVPACKHEESERDCRLLDLDRDWSAIWPATPNILSLANDPLYSGNTIELLAAIRVLGGSFRELGVSDVLATDRLSTFVKCFLSLPTAELNSSCFLLGSRASTIEEMFGRIDDARWDHSIVSDRRIYRGALIDPIACDSLILAKLQCENAAGNRTITSHCEIRLPAWAVETEGFADRVADRIRQFGEDAYVLGHRHGDVVSGCNISTFLECIYLPGDSEPILQ